LLLCGTTLVLAQRRGWRSDRGTRSSNRNGVPDWEIDPRFAADAFTFVRVKYDSGGWGYREKWRIDYPDSDLNFSLRLQQLTSLKVNPDPIWLELTDPRLFDYPFLYLIEPGEIVLSDAEARALRRYLLNGGFLMVDDFWGANEYVALERAMKQVFPKREAVEVPLSHEIFQCVYPLKEKPQVPSIGATRYYEYTGEIRSWEPRPESDTSKVNYRAIFDDEDRIMVFICHNTDLGDGWEREGMNRWYFEEFSVKKAYPMGINIVTYAMTH
jgi:hypothetical protein